MSQTPQLESINLANFAILHIPTTFNEARNLSWQLITSKECMRLPKDQEEYHRVKNAATPEDNKKKLENLLDGKEINLADNLFGYSRFLQFLPEVKHKMVLAKRPLSPGEIDSFLMNECGLHPKDYFWFENPREKQTVPQVFHVHVFINNQENN